MKNRVFSARFKAEAVRRMQAGESPSALAKELDVRRKLLYEWRERVAAGKALRTVGRPKQKPEAELAARDAERIQQLERLVGELTLENRFFRGALQRIKDVRQQSGARGVMPSSPKSKR